MIYHYRAFKNQEIIVGTIEGGNEREAIQKLKENGLRPIRVWEDISQTHDIRRRVTFSRKELSLIFKQLSLLLSAGILIDRSIEMVGADLSKKKREVFWKIHSSLVRGESLSEAFKGSGVFSPFICNMIYIGENSSRLSHIFLQLSYFYKKDEEMRQRIYGALTYPLILLFVTFTIVNFLILYVIPRFEEIFEGVEALLPLPTRILLGISNGIRHHFLGILLVFLLLILIIFYRVKRNLKSWHGLYLKSRYYLKLQTLRFSFSLSLLLDSGIHLEQALDFLQQMEENLALREKYRELINYLKSGYRFTQSLEKLSIFPPMMISMVRVGEETSQLSEIFENIYLYYDQEMEVANKRFITLLEPVFIIVLALIVGFIVLSIALPIFDLVNRI